MPENANLQYSRTRSPLANCLRHGWALVACFSSTHFFSSFLQNAGLSIRSAWRFATNVCKIANR